MGQLHTSNNCVTKSVTRKRSRRAAIISALCCATAFTPFVAIAPPAIAAEASKVANFEIPIQPIEMALLAYSEQAGVQLIMATNVAEGIQSNAVAGEMDIAVALDKLLNATGLSYEFSGPDTVTIFLAAFQEADASSGGDEEAIALARSGARDRRGVDQIIVTAEKRAVSAQRTAISIAAYDSDSLERSVLEDIYDIGLRTPGVIVNKEIVGKIYIRGIGTENLTMGGDPGVAVHTDGAYIARTSAANFDLHDVERVEVLRGPQGTLYGRNATGGSINIISKAPTDEFYAKAEFQYGSYDRTRFAGIVSGPLSDKVQARLSFVKSDRDGFAENLFTGVPLDTEDLAMGRLRLRFLPTDAVTFDLIGEFSIDDSKPAPFKQLEFSPLFEGMNGAFDPPGLRPVSQESPVEEQQDQYGVTGIFNWDLSSVTLTSISSYRNVDFFAAFDGDAVDITFQNFSDDSASEQITQEIRLASNNESALEWILGGYYFHDNGDQTISIPIPGFGFDILHIANIKTDAFAVFGQGTLKLTDSLNFTAGLRYSTEDKVADQFSDFGFIPPLNQSLSEDSDALTPRFAIEYFPHDNAMIYASATRGFKSGGFTFNGFQSNFDPEFVWAYEGGVKTQFADNRVQANLSAFYYDYSDLQVSKLENNAGVITNAADATIWGGEFEFITRPNEYFEFNAGLSYLNAQFDQFLTEDPSNPLLGTIDLAGNRLTRSPEFSANLGAQFEYPVGHWGRAALRVDYQYQGKSFFTAFNRDLSAQQAFSLVNARLSLNDNNEKWQFAVFVKNAFDETYFLNILESGVEAGKPEGFLAPPRTWGLQFSRAF